MTNLSFTNTKENCFAIPNPRNYTRSPPFPHQRAGRGPRRAAPTRVGHALARKGDRRRSVAGRAVGDDSETRALLGDRVRLAHVRGETERPAEFHDRDRWA